MRDNGKVVKINMPHEFRKDFMEDAYENYNDHYWLKIAFETKMYRALLFQHPLFVQEQVDKVKQDLKRYIDAKYKEVKE